MDRERLDRSLAVRAGLIQLAGVAVISVAWLVCSLVTATALRLPAGLTMLGAVLAGLPSLLAVVVGLHWLGALLAVALFALWCGRLEPRHDAPAPA